MGTEICTLKIEKGVGNKFGLSNSGTVVKRSENLKISIWIPLREGVKKKINYPGGIFHGQGGGEPPIRLNN